MNDSRMFPFPAMLDRMQYIIRWSLMRNSQPESLKQHSFDVAIIADVLCAIYNEITKKDDQPRISHEKVVRLALYHDAAEIICSDLPTPIKYQNPEIATAFKQIEKQAVMTILGLMPKELQPAYINVMVGCGSREDEVVHAADKLSAYCKCLNEEASGNHEFVSAKEGLWNSISIMAKEMEEVQYFVERFLPFYGKTLDQMVQNRESGSNEEAQRI